MNTFYNLNIIMFVYIYLEYFKVDLKEYFQNTNKKIWKRNAVTHVKRGASAPVAKRDE